MAPIEDAEKHLQPKSGRFCAKPRRQPTKFYEILRDEIPRDGILETNRHTKFYEILREFNEIPRIKLRANAKKHEIRERRPQNQVY